MVDVAVALPEPRPEDDEDVVWGLSTASALWLRGERRDAIVWLRRAAEAAISAGQGFRGSELGICASDLEQALDEAAGHPPPAGPSGEPATSPFTEPTLPSAPGLRALGAEARSAPPPERATIDVDIDMGAPILPPPPPLRLIPPPPPAPTFSPSAFTPAPSAVAPGAPGSSSYRPPPPVSTASAQSAPSSNRPPPPTGTTPSHRPPPPAPKPAAPGALPPPTGAGGPAPAARSTTITPPPPPVVSSQRPAPPPPTSAVERLTPAAPAVISSAPPAPSGQIAAPPASSLSASPPDPARSLIPSSRTVPPTVRKAQPRAPILDPWAEEPTQPSGRAHESIRVAQATSGDEVILARRKRTNTRNSEDEEEVVTSAVSLDAMLGRKMAAPPPPPTRKPTIPDGLPGQLAHAAPAVPSKTPVSDAKPAAPPPAPAALPVPAVASPAPVAAPPASAVAPAIPPPAPAIPPPAPMRAPMDASPMISPATSNVSPSAPPPPTAPRVAPPAPSAGTGAKPSVPPLAPVKAAPPLAPPRATPSKAPPPPPAEPAEPPSLGSVPLEDVDPFGDLPPDVQQHLVEIAVTRTLAADEALSGFGTALLIEGEAVLTATGSEAPASRAVRGTLVPARGSISEAVEIRLVAGPDGATVASWERGALEEAFKSCPWVMEEITERAERLQALAGATLGPLGQVDEISRNQLLDQLGVRVAQPGQAVAAQGETLNGVALVCAGTIELLDDTDAPWKSLRPGDLLFARAVLEGRPAPCRARAGAGGALLLVGEQGLAQALIAESPSLATFLSSTNE